jgi:phenylpropionate dioxygenase-like ring-hydroxylating dioxygenase large terminal subunit
MSVATELVHGTTSALSAPRTTPASRYSDPGFLDAELRHVFRRAWTVACPEYRVRKPGQHVLVEELGESIVVTRDDQGRVRAFHNSCRHRGTRLVCRAGQSSELKCAYHGWTYSHDGRLREVPEGGGFERLDRTKLDLVPVRAETFAGQVWINLDPDAPPLTDALGGIDRELEHYRLEEMEPIQQAVWEMPVNWKAVLDNATEYYHAPVVHHQTIDKHVATRPELVTYGDHTRQTLPIAPYEWRRWVDLRTSRGGPYSDKELECIHKYLIFPNTLMNVLPYHLTIFQTFPIDAERCRFHYVFFKRRGARGLEWLRAYATWAASRYILREDVVILHLFQQGVRTGRTPEHVFHQYESAILHHERALTRWIDGRA